MVQRQNNTPFSSRINPNQVLPEPAIRAAASSTIDAAGGSRLPPAASIAVYSAVEAERKYRSWWTATSPAGLLRRLAREVQADDPTAIPLTVVYALDGTLFGVVPVTGDLYGFSLPQRVPPVREAPPRSAARRAAVEAGVALDSPAGAATYRAAVFALAARLAGVASREALTRELTEFRPYPPGPTVVSILIEAGGEAAGAPPADADSIVGRLLATYRDGSCEHVQAPGSVRPPQPVAVRRAVDGLLPLLFPGYCGPLAGEPGFGSFVCRRVSALQSKLSRLVRQALAFQDAVRDPSSPPPPAYRAAADRAVVGFFDALPEVRRLLSADAEAAYRNDPALAGGDRHTAPLAYPGLYATAVHRVAHQLHGLGVPYLPRMMSELAHSKTGIDIHPAARIGRGFFVDHGTGVVVGETAVIGEHVTLYQGVTIGALNFEWDESGNLLRGAKRHPTLHSRTTVYAGAAVLGDVEVGHSTRIGANVSLRQSVHSDSVVRIPFSLRELSISSPKLALQDRAAAETAPPATADPFPSDPEIATPDEVLFDAPDASHAAEEYRHAGM